MTLYELYTGGIGTSYERCYVWARDTEEAYGLAFVECQKTYPALTEADVRGMRWTPLFSADAASFCSPLSDNGFGWDEQ